MNISVKKSLSGAIKQKGYPLNTSSYAPPLPNQDNSYLYFSGGETQAGDPVKIQNIPVKTGPSLKLAVNVIVATTVNLKLRLSSKHRYHLSVLKWAP